MQGSQVPVGYKLTEVGVIPEDWEVKPIGSLGTAFKPAIKAGPFGSSLTKNIYVSSGYKIYGQEQVIRGDYTYGDYFISPEKYKELQSCAIKAGDILLSLVGTTGKVLVIPENAPQGIINPRLIRFSFDSKVVFSSFFKELFESNPIQNRLAQCSQGGTMGVLNAGMLRPFYIQVPPLPEQEAIALVLSDTDALITSLDKLIAKKRDIKKAAMQQLLEMKESWMLKSFGDVFNFSGGYTASRDQLSTNGFCYLHYGDIHGSKKTFIDVAKEFDEIPKLQVNLRKVSSKSLLNDGDVVFVDASEDDEGTSRHVVIKNSHNITYISGLHTIVAKSKDNLLNNEYKSFCFQSSLVKNQFKFFAVGTKVSGISKTNIAKINIFIPSIEEQQAISKVLSDMDSEISALEQRRDKTKALKQAMMQELLTGKTRLKS